MTSLPKVPLLMNGAARRLRTSQANHGNVATLGADFTHV